MTDEDLFSKAVENPNETVDVVLPKDDIDASAISSSSDMEENDSSSSSDNDSDDNDQGNTNVAAEEDEEEDEEPSPEGAIRSKHEIEEEPIPDLPEDYEIDANANITEIGFIKSAFENNIIIHCSGSGERRVLKEGSILCLEDHTIIGTLCEVFGKLDNPFYRVTLPASKQAQFDRLKERIGEKAHIVVPEAHWVDTFELRKIKGTDASNGYDEELSEDEQEFSDDEKEALFKKLKKEQRKKKNVNVKELREQVEAGNYKRPKQQHQQKQSQQYPKIRPPVGMINHGYRSRNARQGERTQQTTPISHFQGQPISQPIPQPNSQPPYQQPMYHQQPLPTQQPVFYHQSPQAYPSQMYSSPPVQNPNYQGAPPPLYNVPYGQQGAPMFQQQMYPGQPYMQPQPQPQQQFNQYGAAGYAPQGQPNMQQVLQLHNILMQQQATNQASNQRPEERKEFDYDD
ncbi:RNA-binding snoRNP assembly protein TDEL_0B05080 [Torulaspora delbrueckii]|uniref:H/ACA ribonucleoprotein complex non-core subunit NAF1 n=1 Tax=Torulaspora delbrueckii TaxID=4950 RepID=G8ZPU3_TORDE|nr:hypothetical protein TDEL_0B05080 [Torulaspora delbrueckii]CCE90637.1 hypothetical protein TDEL_0B05080 [Torulaspora delbrueckii]